MAIPEGITGIDGGVIFPAGIDAPTLSRRNLPKRFKHLRRRLLDPQLYLACLPATAARSSCVNLASYGWFPPVHLDDYESAEQDLRGWKRDAKATIHRQWTGEYPRSGKDRTVAIKRCVTFQIGIGCEAIVLPVPLTSESASNFSEELAWIDEGMSISETHASGKDRFVTIALSDVTLRHCDPYANDLLSVVVDQVSARGSEGAYIVIEQASESGYYCSHPWTVGSLLRLVHELRAGGIRRIALAPFGMAALLGVAIGAEIWSVGWYRGERRVRLSDIQDQIGMAVPTFYAHQLATEIHLEADLNRIARAGFLSYLDDETEASRGLLRAIRSGRPASSVQEWQHRKSNVAAAKEHFLTMAARITKQIASQDSATAISGIHDWLKKAEALSVKMIRMGNLHPRTETRHQSAWLKAFERFRDVAGV